MTSLPNSQVKSALVVGAGSIGRRHLSNLKKLGLTRLAACDPHPERLEYVAGEFQAECFPSIEDGLEKFQPDIVLVCTPPVHHISQALQAVRAGAHIFVEKPLSDRMDGVEELRDEVAKRGAVVQVGYNLRFHPAIQKLKELVDESAVGRILWAHVEAGSYLPDWRPWQDYRKSYTARRELGGGILLDGSHELDYVTWLFGAPQEVACMAGRVSQLEVNVEDCATVLLRFPDGKRVDVHLDFIQRSYSRYCALVGPEGKLQWDLLSNSVQILRPKAEPEIVKFNWEINDAYVAELAHFLDCVQKGAPSKFKLEEAILTLRVALAARASAEERKWVFIA
ncbi:MAG: Gfo/Idh/MocA family oxidoreductase [Candidatus Sulfotelmatobacter sp.]